MRRLQADLDGYLAFAASQEAEMEPTHLELPFGFEDLPGGLPALRLGDGVLLRGRIDRVDLTPEGEAIVYDYKSGRVGSDHAGARWGQSLRLQIPLYMRVASELIGVPVRGGLYQPLGGGDPRPRGAVAGRTAGLDCVRTDIVEPERLDELVQEASEAALAAAAQARAGLVEGRPATCSPGGGCRYPGICRCVR